MSTASKAAAASLRAELDHPVIDIDGHTVEFLPALGDYLADEGVRVDSPSLRRTESGSFGPVADWYGLSPVERAKGRVSRGPWGGASSENVLDLATGLLPGLLYERLDELGIDFSVIYPSMGLLFMHLDDEHDRRGACRALNRCNAELFTDYADRLTPVAVIPMHTPEEALAELDHAVLTLGFKAVVLAGFVQRPVDILAERDPEAASYALWTDTYGIDSIYDYDPVWARCRDLGVSPSFHSGALGWQNRRSISSYVYNHIGMLGESNHAVAKSLFIGGVTRRFPELNFAFLEGGVAWAASLLCDIIGHWEKRNGRNLERLDPEHLDWSVFTELFERHAPPSWRSHTPPPRRYRPEDRAMLDEFAAARIETLDDIRDLFVPRFFFGCEADDPMTTTAFNTKVNPFGSRLQAMFGSDISHWDVPDMAEVLPEAYEMVEHGLITGGDFRAFVYEHPVSFYTRTNRAFFKGTTVEAAADALLPSS